MVAMLVGPGPASADAGCQAFGQLAALEAQLETGVGEEVSAAAPANDDVNLLKWCAELPRRGLFTRVRRRGILRISP